MRKPFRLVAVSVAVATLSTACATDVSVAVEEPWARTSSVVATNGAVYMVLRASGDTALVGVTVDDGVAARAEIHESVPMSEMGDGGAGQETTPQSLVGRRSHDGDDHSGEAFSMQPVDSLELPAGEDVVLAPGGTHIMLFDLVDPLESGEEFDLTLDFDAGDDATVTVEVRDEAP